MLAFRCKSCGHLEHAEHAGENELPHACSVCGKGIRFGGNHDAFAARLREAKTDAEIHAILEEHALASQTKTLCHHNWEVLADATRERLEELGLKPEQVARHEGRKFSSEEIEVPTRHIAAAATETQGIEDKVG